MIKAKRFFLFIIGFLVIGGLAGSPCFGQSLDQHVSADSLQAGDLFYFNINLKKDQAYDRIIYPDSSSFSGDFELRSRKKYRVANFKDSLRYQLQFWATGSATIPALPVKLVNAGDTTIIYTRPVTIGFRSVLPKNKESNELRPLKPIYDFAAAWWPYLVGLLILLLAAGLIYYLYHRHEEQPAAEPPPEFTPQPFLNPIKEFENNLRQLDNISLTDRAHFEQFYVSLGDAIRLYFNQMYGMSAMESTSGEIIRELNRRAIDEKLIEQTRIVLRDADLVKFANFNPTREQAQKSYEKARDFLGVAKELHGPRINQMRRQHLAKVQEARRKFDERQNQTES